MNIDKLVLNNFRIFSGCHEFDFSNKKLIVLEGPNGHGKSTIFDAINWAISGRISRYSITNEHKSFKYIMNNNALKNKLKEAFVEIIFDNGLKIKRSVDSSSRTSLFINNERIAIRNGEQIIGNLLFNEKTSISEIDYDSKKIISFIESTLILSQESLDSFVRGTNPQERYKKLEQILGLSRYGQEFRIYLKNLTNTYLDEINNILINKKDVTHSLDLLRTEYQVKLDKSKIRGVKTEEQIVQDLQKQLTLPSKFYLIREFKKSNENHVKTITDEQAKVLINYKEVIMKLLKETDFLYSEINDSENFGNSTDLEKELSDNKRNIKQIVENIKILDEKLIQNSLQLENLNKLEYASKKLRKKELEKGYLIDELSNNDKKINQILDILILKKIDREKIRVFCNKYKESDQYLRDLIGKKNILNYNADLDEIVNKITIEENKKNHLGKKIEGKKLEIKSFQENIAQIEKNKNISLEVQIEDIVNQVQSHILNNEGHSCLVCGKDYRNHDALKSAILIKMEKSKDYLEDHVGIVNGIKSDIKKTEVTIQNLLIEQKTIEEYIDNLTHQKNQIIDNCKKIVLSTPIEINDSLVLDKLIIDKKSYIDEYMEAYQYAEKLLELEKIFENINKQIRQIQEEINTIEYNNKDNHNLLRDESFLKISKNKIDTDISECKLSLKNLEEQKSRYKLSNQNLELKLEKLSKIRIKLVNLVETDVEIDSLKISRLTNNIQEALKKELRIIDNLLLDIEKYLNERDLRNLEISIKEKSNKEKELIIKHQDYTLAEEKLKEISDFHFTTQGQLLNEYLNDLSSMINVYFRQISPHSYSNYVDLNTQNNELFIMLNDESTNSINIESDKINASLTLSSAQSTVLAMSIFLALNKTQNLSKLKLIGIDDPFQNLDDINAYSFIDVISNLVLEDKRQIIISTHDSDFAKLTLSKINLPQDEFTYFKISSYTNDAIEIHSKNYLEIK